MSGVLHGVIASLKAAAAAATDSFFNYVTLLLNTTSTNGAQNNTFLDSSTNNFTITRNGDTTQGSFTPYMPNGYWGAFFDGTGDFLSVANNAAFDLGSSNFTIEAWVNPSSFTNGYAVASRYNFSGGSASGWVIRFVNATTLRFVRGNDVVLDGTVSASVGTWYHVAAVRNGSTLTLYFNGTQVAQATGIANFTDATTALQIGRTNTATDDANGYTSNLRVVKGTAVYTAAFTPPTSPLTAITNTSLLTCQSNRFIDNSSNAFAITRNGDTLISKFSPFNPTAAWSAGTNGGSGYFDGTGDYLSVADSTALDLNSTYTIDVWFYQPAAGNGLVFGRGGGAASWSNTNGAEYLIFIETGVFYYQFNNGSGSVPASITVTAPAAGAWHHVAIGYNGTTTRVWLDGASIGTSASGYSLPTTRNLTNVGLSPSGGSPFTGYVSNLRVVKGTDVYGVSNTSITVPTAPLTAITNTSLLLNFTNAGIYDASTINNAQTVGNAQVSTTVAKFGTTSMYFDGTGDYLSVPDNAAFDLGGGDFTIEAFVYLPSLPASNARYNIFGKWGPNPGANDLSYIGQLFNDAGTMKITFDWSTTGTTTTAVSITASVVAAAWLHIAWVRSGTSLKIFLNGTEVTSGNTITGTLWNSSRPLNIGRNEAGNSNLLNGYIDELRITKGYARYTANFTPPTAAFPTS